MNDDSKLTLGTEPNDLDPMADVNPPNTAPET